MKTNKVLFSVIIFILCNSFLFSQDALKKGVYNLSGGISYSNSKTTLSNETSKQFSFSIVPSFNYFIIDNLLIGSSISFNYNEFELSSNSFNYKSINRQFGIGPNIRYYFAGLNIIPFIGISASYSKAISSKQEGNNFSIMAGINYFLSNSVALEPYLAYSLSSYNRPEQDTNTFTFGFRMNYFIIN